MDGRILIVDDEEGVAFFLGENLAELGAGYEVETAHSGEEALTKMAVQPFDLVVTDLRMPGMDGLELLAQVRVRHPATGLILMTAHGDAKIEASAYQLGVCHALTKPFAVEELIATVCKALTEPGTPDPDCHSASG